MNKFIKSLLLVGILNVLTTNVVVAQTQITTTTELTNIDLTKSEVKSQVIEACQKAAKIRYGENSIKYISTKVKWMKGMGGAMVKMKVKPESKRVTKYSCVLQKNQLVKFYKV